MDEYIVNLDNGVVIELTCSKDEHLSLQADIEAELQTMVGWRFR